MRRNLPGGSTGFELRTQRWRAQFLWYEALARVFAGSADANGQPNPQPHDRCNFYAFCANSGESLSVQGWAICYKP